MTERTFMASCNVCGRAQNWDDEIAAQADSVWHVYREHRETWLELVGEDRPPQDSPPEDHGKRLGPETRIKAYDQDDPRIGSEVPDRLFSAAVLAACERIVAENINRWGWDVPPVLGILFQGGRSPVTPDMTFHGIELGWYPIPETVKDLVEAERPHHVIVKFAYGLRQAPAELREAVVGDTLMGVLLLSEGWMVLGDVTDPEETAGKLADRVEVKMLTAVDINGVRYGIHHGRDEEKPWSQAGLHQRGASGVGGDVPNSLHYLVEALQGHTLPEWPEWSERFQFEVPGQ